MDLKPDINRLSTDFGGLDAPSPVNRSEHEMLPWEKSCHALLDILDYHKIVNTEEKRRGISELGSGLVSGTSYYEKWILSAARVLMQKGILTPGELATKSQDVAERYLND